MGYMTRDEMVAVIRSRQVLVHKGRLLATEADLPSEADLARESGDPARRSEARESLLAAKGVLDAQIAELDKPRAPVEPGPGPRRK